MRARKVTRDDRADWIRMRTALWSESPEDHPIEIDEYFASSDESAATFVVENEGGNVCGFLEAGTRPFAEGCNSRPVGYIEGWWVDPGHRRRGMGAALVAAAEEWARDRGLTEMASDTYPGNELSRDAHRALGYKEAATIICFSKQL